MGKLVLGADFETTGLSAVDDRIVEVGAVLYDWDAKTPICLLSMLVHPERPIPPEVTKIHGITDDMVDTYGKPERQAIGEFEYLLSCADYAMAHKVDFDKPFHDAAIAREGFEPTDTLWLCSMQDIKYPESITTRNLRHLAAEHDFCNPFAHRALFDVLTMLKVASNYDLDAIVARAQEPTLYVQALVSFDEKEKAKELQFRWFAPDKIWWRSYKGSDYEAMKDTCGFKTRLLAGPLE